MLILHNNRCSKSREALQLLVESNCEIEIRDYLKNPLSKDEIKELLAQLGLKAKDLVRKKEKEYIELFKDKEPTNAQLITAMAKFPILIERPIVIKNGRAEIGRPISKVVELIES